MVIITAIKEINAQMNNADSLTHFSSFRLAESIHWPAKLLHGQGVTLRFDIYFNFNMSLHITILKNKKKTKLTFLSFVIHLQFS
jgi:hypothetical protein